MIPVHIGERSVAKNYRLLCLSSVVNITFEKSLNNRLADNLEKCDFLFLLWIQAF